MTDDSLPELADELDPVEAIGTMLRASIIGYLRTSGPAGRAQIARDLNLLPVTVGKALRSFLSADLIIAEPPLDQVRQGQRVTYRVNNPAISEMYLGFGQAIGEL